jgi:hypothetical protein
MKSAAYLLLLALVFVSDAQACSCALQKGTREQTVRQSREQEGQVFIARLRFSTLAPDVRYPTMITEDAEFEVLEVFKGSLRPRQLILVHQTVSSGSCGQSSTNDPLWMENLVKPATGDEPAVLEPLVISKEWLIYAHGPEPYELSLCTRTAPLNADGERDVHVLRKRLKSPATPPQR